MAVGHLATCLPIQRYRDPTIVPGLRTPGLSTYRSVVTGPKSPDLLQATNCMINFTVDRDDIIDDATITGAKCRIGPHGKMRPPGLASPAE